MGICYALNLDTEAICELRIRNLNRGKEILFESSLQPSGH